MEQLKGVVANINEKGLKIEGETKWHNFCLPEYRNEPWETPSVKDTVLLGVSSGGDWIQSIEVMEQAKVEAEGADAPEPTKPAGDKDYRIMREVALKAAAHIIARRLGPPEELESRTLALASTFFSWLREEPKEA